MTYERVRGTYSSGGSVRRKPLIAARCFFDCRRRSRAGALGLVGRRGRGATAARRISSTRRARVIPLARLRALSLRVDIQHALAGEPPSAAALEPRAHPLWDARRPPPIDA